MTRPVPPQRHQPRIVCQVTAVHPVRQTRDFHLVLVALPARVRLPAQAVPLRVLPQVHEVEADSAASHPEVLLASPARHRDLPEGRPLRLRGGREHKQNLLSEPLPSCQAILGPQDALLRRGALPFLRSHQERREGMSLGWILLQREALSAKVQRQLHHDHAPLPAEGVWATPHRFQLSPLQGRATAGHSGKASLRPGSGLLSFLLEVRHLRIHPCQQKAATGKLTLGNNGANTTHPK